MGLFYKISDKEMLKIRNEIFLENGILPLEKNGFIKSPFNFWHGRNNLNDFDYTFCRINNGFLEMLFIYIAKGDSWIEIKLNIFKLDPIISSLDEIHNIDGLEFIIPPYSNSSMQLRMDDYKIMPLFVFLFMKLHKIRVYNSQRGLKKRIKQLGKLIKKDMTNINYFISKWHKTHIPVEINWKE